MKRIIWLIIIALLLVPQAGSLGFHPIQPAVTLFPNGGFETDPSDPSNGWTWPSDDWIWDGSIAHDGTHSARISRSGGNETTSVYSAYVSVQPSTVYTLSYWMRTQDATFWSCVMLYQYTNGQVRTGPWLLAYGNIGNGTTDWSVVNYRFQTMPDATQLQLRLFLYTDTTGTFWFDDFSLEEEAASLYPFLIGFPVVASGWVWMPSPSVADINNDGDNELLIGAGNAINGWSKTGTPLPGFPLSTGDRMIIAQVALADLDHNGHMEIVAGTRTPNPPEGQCRVFAWRDNGELLPGWPKTVAWETQYSAGDCWITSVVLADIDCDHNLEILASTTNNGSVDPYAQVDTPNLYAWHMDGSLVSGNWPNWQTTVGIYGALAAGDLSGDGKAEVVVGRDFLYLNAYGSDGQSLTGWPIQTYVNHNGGDYDTEQRIEYSVNAPIIADLDGDGEAEIIVAGHVKGPGEFPDVKLNSALLVLEPDGTRRPGWEVAALGNGILAQDDLPWQAPAVADLNNDGDLEIVVATEDGWIRAYNENKIVLWAFNYTQGATLFATDPVIGDIDGDGSLEILFGTYVPIQDGGNWDGPVGLWALRSNGTVMPEFPLAIPTPGVRAAPTLADLDGNGDLEILVATREGQIIAWDTSTIYNPVQLPWPTGRHDLNRSATYLQVMPLAASHKSVTPQSLNQGETATFTIHIISNSPLNNSISLTDTIPSGLSYIPGSLTATSGVALETGGVIHWSGNLPVTLSVEITYDVTATKAMPQAVHNTAIIDSGSYGILTRTATLYTNFLQTYLPTIKR